VREETAGCPSGLHTSEVAYYFLECECEDCEGEYDRNRCQSDEVPAIMRAFHPGDESWPISCSGCSPVVPEGSG